MRRIVSPSMSTPNPAAGATVIGPASGDGARSGSADRRSLRLVMSGALGHVRASTLASRCREAEGAGKADRNTSRSVAPTLQKCPT